ncbi:ATP-dependent DNA helicase RecG [Pedobacter sp. ok626]|nr:ATP-dependent DNA helicase RecG [Pedobacter sp. ok626]
MQQNGSPDPDFETDDERSYFQVTLKIHPGFLPENNVSTSSEITEGAKNNPATSNYPIYVDIKVIEGVSTRLKDKLGKTLQKAHKIL